MDRDRDRDPSRPRLWVALAGAVVVCVAVLGLAVLLDAGGPAGHDGVALPSGSVVLMRHTATDTSQTDADPTARGSCAQQRNLSAAGVAQARAIGEAIGARDVAVDAVLASPFCRTVDTAVALGLGEVEATDLLLSLTAAPDRRTADWLVAEATRLIEVHLGGDDIAVMVTHTQNIEALTGELVEEGGAVVLTAGEGGALAVGGVIAPDDW